MDNIFKPLILVLALSGTLPAYAGSVAGFGGSTEITQIMNNGQLMAQYHEMLNQTMNQIRMVQAQLSQYQTMIRNTTGVHLPIFGEAQNELNKLGVLVGRGRAVAYNMGSIDGVFRSYGDYSYSNTDLQRQNLSDRYREWNQINADTTRNTLEAAGLQSQQFADETSRMQQLQSMSNSADGRMAAIQIGNQIAAQNIEQMQKLRQLSLLQIQQQSAYLATKNEKQAIQQAETEAYFRSTLDTNVNNGGRF